MGSAMYDLFRQVKPHVLYHARRAAAGTETVTSAASIVQGGCFDALGFEGIALAIASVYFDASAATVDGVVVTIQKCSATDGTDAATLAAMDNMPGTAGAHFDQESAAIALYSLGEVSAGTPYRYVRASIVITDANSSGTYDIFVALLAGSQYKEPVTAIG